MNSQSPAFFAIQTCINTEQRENKEVSRWMSHSKHRITYKQYNKKLVMHLIAAPQLSNRSQHYYSAKTRQVGRANEQSMYSLMSLITEKGSFLFLVAQGRKASKAVFILVKVGLATLGRVTKIETILSVSCHPRWPRQVQ